jgi:hypothetical protein
VHNHNHLHLCDTGKWAVLQQKKRERACKEYSGANQQNIADCFSLLWGKPTSQHCARDILSKKTPFNSLYHHPSFNTNIGGEQSMAL